MNPQLMSKVLNASASIGARWRLIVASTAIGVALALINHFAWGSTYSATVRILLIQQRGRPLSVTNDDPVRDDDRSEDFIPAQMTIIQSPEVVRRAIEVVGRDKLPTLVSAGKGAPTIDLARLAIKKFLKVTRPDRLSTTLTIEYRAGSPAEAIRMVTALTECHRAFLEDAYRSDNSRVVSLIIKARDELEVEMAELERKTLEFRKAYPLLAEDSSGHSLINSRIIGLDHAANDAMTRATRLRSQLEVGKALAAKGAELWSVAYAIAQFGEDPGGTLIPGASTRNLDASSEHILALVREHRQLSESFGPQYSKVKELKAEIDESKKVSKISSERIEKGGVGLLLSSIELSAQSVERMRDELFAQFKVELEGVKKNSIDQAVGRSDLDRLERHKELFHAVVSQLRQAQLSGDFSEVITRILEAPNSPPTPINPSLPLMMAMGLMGGFLVGVGAAAGLNRLDLRLKSTDEFRTVIGLDVLGTVPMIVAEEESLSGDDDAAFVGHESPRSIAAEAYKAVRTSLDLLGRERPFRVVMVTSPMMGEGKTTTAVNLAISLAHAGRRTLLVDADLRRPRLARLFGRQGTDGLVNLLWGHRPLAHLARPTAIENLDLLVAGDDAHNPSELLMSHRMREFLEEARQVYDTVIIDSSPLLMVTDPSIIGAAVDGILLVVRASETRRCDLERASEFLEALRTPILGMVVNGVRFRRSDYYRYQYHDEHAADTEIEIIDYLAGGTDQS